MEEAERTGERIVKQERIQDLWISTVFLGLDHNYSMEGPPVLFESLVFWEYEKPVTQIILGRMVEFNSEALDDTMRRYRTWDEALAGHKALVREARLKFLSVNGGS